jgi:hypothetical protein
MASSVAVGLLSVFRGRGLRLSPTNPIEPMRRSRNFGDPALISVQAVTRVNAGKPRTAPMTRWKADMAGLPNES